MDTSRPIAWRPSESDTRIRLQSHTGIRNTEERREVPPIPGFRTRFSLNSSSVPPEPPRSSPAGNELAARRAPSRTPRPSSARLRHPAGVRSTSHRDFAHEGEGAGTGKRNTDFPGFRTRNAWDLEHGTTGIPNTKGALVTGRPCTEIPGSPRSVSRSLALTLSSNQIKNQSTVLLLSSRYPYD